MSPCLACGSTAAEDLERARGIACRLEQENAHLRDVLLQVMNVAERTLLETS